VSRMQERRSHESRGLGCQMMRSALRGILWIAVLGPFSAAAAGAAPTAKIFVSDELITPADLTGAFAVTVAFDQTMSETVSPDVVFSPSVSAALTGGAGVWSTSGVFASDRYAVSFHGADADQEAIDVDVTVSGAQSPSPELMQSATLADAFDVDTAAPTVNTQDVTVQLDETGTQQSPWGISITDHSTGSQLPRERLMSPRSHARTLRLGVRSCRHRDIRHLCVRCSCRSLPGMDSPAGRCGLRGVAGEFRDFRGGVERTRGLRAEDRASLLGGCLCFSQDLAAAGRPREQCSHDRFRGLLGGA